jgi:putative DNA primase/helicase
MEYTIISTLADFGFLFAPASKGMTRSNWDGWPGLATSNKSTLAKWVQDGNNLVAVAKHGFNFSIDIDDVQTCLEQGFKLEWLDGYLLVDTPSGGIHVHGLQTADMELLGTNVNVHLEKDDKNSKKILELKLHNHTVAAPTAIRLHQKGKVDGEYKPHAMPATIKQGLCPELLEWMKANAEISKPATKKGESKIEFHPDFDRDDYLERHNCTEQQSGMYQGAFHVVVDECPVCGKKANDSTLAAGASKFIFGGDGKGAGYTCHACNIFSRAELEEKLAEEDPDWEPYDGYVYRHNDPRLVEKDILRDFQWFNVEIDDDSTREVEEPAEPTAKELKKPDPIKDVVSEPLITEGVISNPLIMDKPFVMSEYEIDNGDDGGELRKIYVYRADMLTPKRQLWLWDQRFPAAATSLVTGKADCGKSTVLLDMAARVSKGLDFPDGAKNPYGPQEVLIFASEDDPHRTIVPRLMAAGADLSKVYIFHCASSEEIKVTKKGLRVRTQQEQKEAHINLVNDLHTLYWALKTYPDIKLLILDPLISFIGTIDSNKDKEVRPLMDALKQLCEKSGVSVVGLIHSSKRSDVDSIGQVAGAGSFVNSARAAWGISRDKEDKSLYRMLHVKGNLRKKRTGMKYTMESVTIMIEGYPCEYGRIAWGGEIDEDADDVMQSDREKAKDGKTITKKSLATALIREMLPCWSDDIIDRGKKEGLSFDNLTDAKKDLGIKSEKRGKKWWWHIPLTPAPEPMRLMPENVY